MVDGVLITKPTWCKRRRNRRFMAENRSFGPKTLLHGTKTARFYPNPSRQSIIAATLLPLSRSR
jgi:hypothetical protein